MAFLSTPIVSQHFLADGNKQCYKAIKVINLSAMLETYFTHVIAMQQGHPSLLSVDLTDPSGFKCRALHCLYYLLLLLHYYLLSVDLLLLLLHYYLLSVDLTDPSGFKCRALHCLYYLLFT